MTAHDESQASGKSTAIESAEVTHFGFKDVAAKDKAHLVGEVFTSVADSYDIMNDVMSMGIHRLWKRHFVQTLGVREGQTVLDLAGGTGDITRLIIKRAHHNIHVVLADINGAMLRRGRDRLIDEGMHGALEYAQVNAESLPFSDGSFDHVTMAFGLRNVTDKQTALAELARVLRPGGKASILEFSQLRPAWLRPAYDWYSFNVLPAMGQKIAGDAASYRYLAESIRRHPPQQELLDMMATAGFDRVDHRNLSAGLVAVHQGWKF